MDPLSLVASIAGLISLTIEVTKITTGYVDSVANAAEEAVQLSTELSALRSALGSLHRFLESNSTEPTPFKFSNTSLLVSTSASCRQNLETLQARLDKFHQASQGKKLWYRQLAWPLKKENHVNAVAAIRNFTQVFHFSLSIDGCELLSKTADETISLRETYTGLAKEITEICMLVKTQRQHVEEAHQGQKERDRRELLGWLCHSVDTSINHNLAVEKREPETGDWFLESDQFSHWVRSADFIWLHGIPGCGKTVLCSTIVEATKKICDSSADYILAYFYFDFQRPAEHGVDPMLRSLLRHICAGTEGIPAEIQELYAKHHPKGSQPGVMELEIALFGILDNLGKEIYIILDALDEVPDTKNKRPEILKLLRRLVESGRPNLHILATSRDEVDIHSCLAPLSNGGISIQSSTVDADIQKYVRSCLEDDDRLQKLPRDMKEMVESTLGEKSKGMFRWAFCQMDELRTCRRPSDIKRVLSGLPTTLDETYERLLAEISKCDAQEGMSILVWMAFATRPLTLQEVADIAVLRPGDAPLDPDDKLFDPLEVLRICRGLISVSTQYMVLYGDDFLGDIVIFPHFSVQEYLLSGRSKVFDSWSQHTHGYIANCCLSSLLQLRSTEHKLIKEFFEEHQIRGYAAEHWSRHFHLSKVEDGAQDTSLLDRIYRLFDSKQPFYCNWLRIFAPERNWFSDHLTLDEAPPPLNYACYLGLSDTARRIIEAGANVNQSFEPNLYEYPYDRSNDGTPLEVAAVAGHADIVQLLLRHGADVNSRYMWDAGGNVLHATLHRAPEEKASEIANILLDHGADAQRQDHPYGSALALACRRGMEETLLQRLVDAGAGVNDPCARHSGNPLQEAAVAGHTQTVRWLLDMGAEVNAPGHCAQGTALETSIISGNQQIFELLVQHGADVNATEGSVASPLQTAAEFGRLELTERLLDLGADVNAQVPKEKGETYRPRYSQTYGNALQAAAAKGNRDIVQLLIEAGADVNARSKGCSTYGTALEAALRNGKAEVALLLLEHGATG
ncbi:ankyrin repeat-containing domain protein [Cercophora newfieldiana]|uniref:Ankyrin repeat-containing domain protein n=1 Tax=Cercophora newfieldiana TaxID=92897 RepID=A0AA39Y4E9_9PEZI|nr:ankyrin repeat-containing domain protein [Cercophora newfieldiana]